GLSRKRSFKGQADRYGFRLVLLTGFRRFFRRIGIARFRSQALYISVVDLLHTAQIAVDKLAVRQNRRFGIDADDRAVRRHGDVRIAESELLTDQRDWHKNSPAAPHGV